MPDHRGPWALALVGVAAITLLRIVALALTPLDLFVDEAQYWLWGQDLAFGYYSKPPLIGWVIRAFTEVGGDGTFWVRLPGPLFHGATAIVLGVLARRLFDDRAGAVVALGYATLPMVALASVLISTDTILFPFYALALLGYFTLKQGRNFWVAAGTGVAIGLGFLAKYAAVYFLISAGLAALILPAARISRRDAGIMLAAFVVTISPNLIWNMLNGLSTVQHTLDNADWVRDPAQRAGLSLTGLLKFWGDQFAVFGPVLFGGLLVLILRAGRQDQARKTLLIFTLPVLAIVSVQALLSGAYANWAATAYLAGSVAVLPWLGRRWLAGSFAINGLLSVTIPVLAVFANHPALSDLPALKRYKGRADLSQTIIDTAISAGTDTVVADDRGILADLFYTGRDAGIRFYAIAPTGRAEHHYALTFPYVGGAASQVLLVRRGNGSPDCVNVPPVAKVRPQTGTYRGNVIAMYLVPGDCADLVASP